MHLTLRISIFILYQIEYIFVWYRLLVPALGHILHLQGDTDIEWVEKLYPLPTFKQSDSRYSGSLINNVRKTQAVDTLYIQYLYKCHAAFYQKGIMYSLVSRCDLCHFGFFKCSMYARAICISNIVILNRTISMKLSEIWTYMYMLLSVSLIFMIWIKLLQIYVILKCYLDGFLVISSDTTIQS